MLAEDNDTCIHASCRLTRAYIIPVGRIRDANASQFMVRMKHIENISK